MRRSVVCLILCLALLSGCSGNKYSGIEKNNITSIVGSEVTIEQTLKGSKEDWAAMYYLYKNKDDIPDARLLLKYNGKKPHPTGQMTVNYDAGEGEVGTFTQTFNEAPKDGVYVVYLLGIVKKKPLDPNNIIKIHASFLSGKSAYIELKEK